MAEIKIAPSILAANAAELGNELKKIEEAGADYVHIDVMDGHFVPNLAFSPGIVKMLRKHCGLVFDVHLMISEPMKYAEEFVKAGADIVTFHHETAENPGELAEYIHSLGVRVGVSVKPGTDIRVIQPYLDKLDMVLIMTVEPGFGGQQYIEEMNKKIRALKEMIDKSGRKIDIEVDGGVTPQNIREPVSNGANVIVAGSAVFKAADIPAVISEMRSAAR